jgi:hypothetical protein
VIKTALDKPRILLLSVAVLDGVALEAAPEADAEETAADSETELAPAVTAVSVGEGTVVASVSVDPSVVVPVVTIAAREKVTTS